MARLRSMKTVLAALCLLFAVCVDGAIAEDAPQSIDPSDVDVDVDVDVNVNEAINAMQEELQEDAEERLDLNDGLGGDNESDDGEVRYAPPSRFQISAHVQTNLHTGRSYFLPAESLPDSFAHLPFLECGAVGSTTEKLPLVSGVFRHVPHQAVMPKRDEMEEVLLENLERAGDAQKDAGDVGSDLDGLGVLDENGEGSDAAEGQNDASTKGGDEDHPKRPTPPKYVVALSPMEITVGGNGINETQHFDAGDVIFIEDTWWGVWDDEFDDEVPTEQQAEDPSNKGYVLRSLDGSAADLHVLMLTVPDAVHRRWKHAQYALAKQAREAKEKPQSPVLDGTQRPWWKMPTSFLSHPTGKQQRRPSDLPEPCSLESDPAFASPKASATLSQHFAQHFTNILRRTANPHPSFLSHYHQDLLLPILAQTAAAAIGGLASLALVLQLWRKIPGPLAVGFGSACLIGVGTWGFVWLGEEILDQWELWRERRRLEKMMSEGWGRGGGRSGSAE
ncbi:hypothetical protein ACHAXT_009215 [Thalassiosira profunda]